jgi:hypothetical protein
VTNVSSKPTAMDEIFSIFKDFSPSITGRLFQALVWHLVLVLVEQSGLRFAFAFKLNPESLRLAEIRT